MKERFKIYQHLMNGFSYMLPFVVAGGLLIAFSSLDFLSNHFPYLNDVGTLILSYTYPIIAGFIAYSIADRPGIAPGIAAGALALVGDSGFIGAILGGFMAGYVIEIIKFVFKKLHKSLSGIKPVLIYPFFGVLFISLIMLGINYVISPFSLWMVDAIVVMEGIYLIIFSIVLGGLMAVDLGGPINKLAYIVGVISIIHGHQSVLMAAIMAAGMVPALAIALSTFVFKSDYSEAEKIQGKNNWMLGLSFITEGAIPFVKEHKQSLHLSLIIGSMFAAMLVAMFQTSVPAPHGGIFVVFLMDNWWGFVISVVAGMMLSTLLIKFFKWIQISRD